MNDTKSASLVLIAGAVGVGYWFYHLTQGKLSTAAASPAPTDPTGGPALSPSRPPALPPTTGGSYLDRLTTFAQAWGLRITSGFRSGANSLHGEGRAIDVSVPPADVADQVKAAAQMQGIHVYPEAPGQVGSNGSVSTGPHWHLSFPEMKNGRLRF